MSRKLKSGLTIALLVVLYGLCILPARLLGLLLGRDALRLRPMRQKSSYWLARPPVTDMQAYFSQSSPDTSHVTNRYVISIFRGISALYAPRRQVEPESASSGQRQQDIPDEIYTLW
jgi:hypothetical protein